MIYIFIAQGFEETECIAIVDILRRAKLHVKTIGVGSKTITGSHGIAVLCDYEIKDVKPNDDIDAVVLPGGMPGTTNLENSLDVQSFINFAYSRKKLICAICAAPIILGHKGFLNGIEATCFPGYENELLGAKHSSEFVCSDNLFITAKGMGSSVEFGLEIAAHFIGKNAAKIVRESLQCP